MKLIAFLFVFGLVAHEAQAQWFGWPYYGWFVFSGNLL
jgi:hypothetical protein